MPSKSGRRSSRRRRATTQPPKPATASLSAPRIRGAALGVLLKKLDPFLKTLDDSELAAMPDALARMPSLLRSVSCPRPPQPVEVAFARVDKEIVGALLLNRKWMEAAFAQHCNEEVQSASEWPSIAAEHCDKWLEQLHGDLGLWLSRQAEVLPENLYPSIHLDGADTFLDSLEELKTPEEIDRWLWAPIVLHGLQVARAGDREQRKRARKILSLWLPHGRGRMPEEVEDRQPVAIARAVDDAKAKLAECFAAYRKLREAPKPGRYASDPDVIEQELLAKGHPTGAVSAVVGARTLSGAAQRFVAQRPRGRYTAGSIRAMYSRGKRLLGRG